MYPNELPRGGLHEALDPPSPRRRGSRSKLRCLLVATDFTALIAAAALVESIDERRIDAATLLTRTLGAIVAVIVLAIEKLYRARKCASKSNEITGVAHACLTAALFEMSIAGLRSDPAAARKVLATYVIAFAAVCAGRRWYSGYVTRARRNGRYLRPVAIIGSGDGVGDLIAAASEPDKGYTIVGLIGPRADALRYDLHHLAPMRAPDQIAAAVARSAALGVLVCPTGLHHGDLNDLVRILLDDGLHVQVSSGLTGFASTRLLADTVGNESLYYVESTPSLRGGQAAAKRVVDGVLAAAALLLCLPVLVVLGLLVRRDGGPALFRQRRVGKDGREFTMYKLRTMVVNAEALLPQLLAANERKGPLFKLADDPRFTRLGRMMDATSLNELPQLWNVLRGHMSLVGPRPALAREVAQFSDRVLRRHRVRPGITGLWQVEARESPDFEAYARHDVFYVENWSLLLDLSILWRTLSVVAARGRATIARRSAGEAKVRPLATPSPPPRPHDADELGNDVLDDRLASTELTSA